MKNAYVTVKYNAHWTRIYKMLEFLLDRFN